MKVSRSIKVIPLMASVALAVASCAVGSDPSASPVPDDKPVIENNETPTTDTKDTETPSCDDEGVECDDYGNILEETVDENSPSCDDPNVLCDGAGNILDEDYDPDEKPVVEDTPITTKPTSKESRPPERLGIECLSTYPTEGENAHYYASYVLSPVNDHLNPDYIYNKYTIETMDGEVLYSCEDNAGEARIFGLPEKIMVNGEAPELRIRGEVDGHKFDTTLRRNPHLNPTDDDKHHPYYWLYVHIDDNDKMTIYEGMPFGDDPTILPNNA